SEKDSSMTIIADVTTSLENLVETLNGLLKSTIKFEVMAAKGDVASDIEALKAMIEKIKSTSDLGDKEELSQIVNEFTEFEDLAVGDENVVDAQIEMLESREKAKKNLNEAKELARAAMEVIVQLNSEVRNITADVQSDAASTVTTSRVVMIICALLVLALSTLIALWVTKSITTPLNAAVDKIKLAATGDLTVHFETSSNDELGVMSTSMQTLISNLRNILKEISSNSEMLATTAEETTAISEQSFESVNQQKQQTQSMAASIEQMTETVTSVSSNVQNTLAEVETTHNQVNQGEELLKTNISSIVGLASSIEDAAKVISRLNEDTNNIGSVLDVISGVAEQTNLLALNAAIEAARAGEQGRGFAVVADEVRTLASRSQDSTAEIQQLIERLLDGASKAVATMNRSQKETQECVEGVDEVSEMLSNVATSVSTIKDMSHQISVATDQQSAAAKSQNENIVHIADIAEQTSVSAQENQTASQDLSKMAANQRVLVNQFKL
ncbi:methyl-accepting chemotaxis protein, partial [Paraglaciecola sp.]|uniref:methyl-accepting chemotaxis protein n=1 Tax=Paraglaciecola sp. TaxID=1920173 RepID=UPI003EF7284B